MAAKKRALLSVSDKRFITNLARDLIKYGYELVASGGTYLKLKESAIPCKELSKVIKSPELLGGKVKTLHPAVHAAILADRSDSRQMKELEKNGIVPIDIVVVNFYPFPEKVQAGKTSTAAAAEMVDIGGPAMVRAAAKNYRFVTVVSNVEQYRELTRVLKVGEGEVPQETRLQFAGEAFQTTASYEATLAAYFTRMAPKPGAALEREPVGKAHVLSELLPDKLTMHLKQEEKLRYGENPHQRAARYRTDGLPLVPYKFVQGKEMSYNNYLDGSAALVTVCASYSQPYAACVVKHQNPCGIAIGTDPVKTFIAARDADPESAFGGIVGLSYAVDAKLANELRKTFFEIVVAPSFDAAARNVLSEKKNLRLIEASMEETAQLLLSAPRMTTSLFGVFLQGYDTEQETWEQLQIVSATPPPEKLRDDVLTGLTYSRFLKSNSVCIVKDGVMVGAGMGQMSRVAATEIAIRNAGKRVAGAVLVSDGFFPFADSVELAAKAKLGCVVAPAGSKRDMEVVAAANAAKMPLIFGPYRHFLH